MIVTGNGIDRACTRSNSSPSGICATSCLASSRIRGSRCAMRRGVNARLIRLRSSSLVMLRYASANRDEAVFENAGAFDVERENAKEHLSFGNGILFCPGAALAREESRIAVSLLLDRRPGLRLAPGNDFVHHPNMLLRGLKRLDLEFDAS